MSRGGLLKLWSLLLFVNVARTVYVQECIAPWVSIGSGDSKGCFLFIQYKMNWDNARSHCQRHDGDLITLETESKRRDLINYMESNGLRNGHSRHLGANDRDGWWSWLYGNPVDNFVTVGDSNGDSGWRRLTSDGRPDHEPDNDSGDDTCMYLYTHPYPSGRYDLLSDYKCTSRKYFICEKNPATTFTYGGVSFTHFRTLMSFPEAQRHCESEGLQLAKPGEDMGLWKYILNNVFGTVRDESGIWLSGGPRTVSHLIHPMCDELMDEYYDGQSRNCLVMWTHWATIIFSEDRPYCNMPCYEKKAVLCQERGIKKVELFNLVYKMNTAEVRRAPASSKVTVIMNNSDQEQEAVRVIRFSYTTSKDWGKTFSLGGKIEGTVTAGVPSIGSASVTIGVEKKEEITNGRGITKTNHDEIRVTARVPAKSRMSVWVSYEKRKINIDYTSSMKIYYVDGGSIIRRGEPGVFEGVDAAKFHIMYGEIESLE